MTEKDLKDLDFTRVDETAENSGAPNDWHYYTYDVGNFSLISPASDEVEEDGWFFNYSIWIRRFIITIRVY